MLTAMSVLSCAKNPVRKMRYGRVFTACAPETQRVVHRVMHRSIRRFFTGPSPAFARACQLMRVVRRTRSRMTACPRSYDLLLHRLVSDFSTELSPAHQPVLHNLSTGLSTGCTCPLRVRYRPFPASGYRKHRAAYDGCNAKIKNPRASARLQFFSRERESVNRLTGMIGHFHLPAAARSDPTVHLPDDFAA
jgi:hypothetical protein